MSEAARYLQRVAEGETRDSHGVRYAAYTTLAGLSEIDYYLGLSKSVTPPGDPEEFLIYIHHRKKFEGFFSEK